MDKVAFCILTRGRADRQITLDSLHPKIRQKTFLVIDEEETSQHSKYLSRVRSLYIMPKKWPNYLWDGNFSDKKNWIARELLREKKFRYLFFLDDDLKFDSRTNGQLKKARKIETLRMFKILCSYMIDDGFAHVALSAREGNNRVESDYLDVGRAMRVCGFDLDVIFKEGIRFNRLQLMADFDLTLQLLEKGYPNRILYKYANGQRKSNDEGGCSLYRTPEAMTKAANGLKELHPKFVKVQQKKTTKPWAGFNTNVRTDVTVYWKKAYEYGKNKQKKTGIRSLFK